MWPGFQKLIPYLRLCMVQEGGQDIVEYALVISLIGVAATASSQAMAIVLTTALSNVAARFASVY
jgi:Flp pilus assembly pilin Flp